MLRMEGDNLDHDDPRRSLELKEDDVKRIMEGVLDRVASE